MDVLKRARADLGITAANHPARVAQMLANFGIYTSEDWCAAATGTWIREAAATNGVKPPIAGSASALTTMTQLQTGSPKVGWIDTTNLHLANISPGMIAVWQRGGSGSTLGHIGVVSRNFGGGRFSSIEGNAQGGAVVENTHNIADTGGLLQLLGMGYFNDRALFV